VSALRKAKGLEEETSQKKSSQVAFKELEKEFLGQFLLKST